MAVASGQPTSLPIVSGVPCPGTTIPASTRPMKRMKKPMPTEIARFSSTGIASITSFRRPVTTRMMMTMPCATITPIAS